MDQPDTQVVTSEQTPTPRFTPGDCVTISSGGPQMTVIDTGAQTGLVFCRWINPSGQIVEASFPPATVVWPLEAPNWPH